MICINARFLTQSLSGVQRFASELSVRLKKKYGDEIVFLSPKNIKNKELAVLLKTEVIGNHTGYLWEQWDLPRYLREKNSPLLINLCNLAPMSYHRNIVVLHDVAYKACAYTYGWKIKLAYGLMMPKILRHCLHVITVSEFSKEEIMKYYKVEAEAISVVYNAVDIKFKRVTSESIDKRPYIFTISSTGDNKNFLTTLKVFESLQEKIDDIQLYAVGRTLLGAKDTLYKRYANNKGIHFLGGVSDEDLLNYYSNAVAFVYPTKYEGFGIPPLEAQSCNCPVVASNAKPLPEILGNSALCFTPTDVYGLAAGVMQIYSSKELRENLIASGNNNVRRFSWEKSAERLSVIINKFKNI